MADDVNISRLRYKDDEGDFVNLNSDDDWGLVLDMLTSEDFTKHQAMKTTGNSVGFLI